MILINLIALFLVIILVGILVDHNDTTSVLMRFLHTIPAMTFLHILL